MPAAIVAFGAASALGEGRAAFDVGPVGTVPESAWSVRGGDKAFGRVRTCDAARADRPRALFELGLRQLVRQLDERDAEWRRLRVGVIVGTASGGFAALERCLPGGPGQEFANWQKSAHFSPLTGLAQCLGREPDRLVSLYAACASSTLAIGLGLRWLELDQADLVICGGYDAESDLVCAGFDALKATSSGVPRPFRAKRDGMVLGEGVALLALTRPCDDAYGFVRGFAVTTDAVHITAPDRTGQGLARAARTALDAAGISATDIDFVSVHGTGTVFNDAAEAAALRTVFGEGAVDKPLHLFKSSVGHTLGAAGALEVLAAFSALEREVVPASTSPGTPMPELQARVLARNAAGPVQHCLKLSTAFGGANGALVLSRSCAPCEVAAPRPVYLVAAGAPCQALELSRLEGLLIASSERVARCDTLSGLAVAAAGEALRGARATGFLVERLRTGVIVGSVGATLEANAAFAARVLERGLRHAEPRRFPSTSANACAGQVAIAFGLGGPSHSVGAGSRAPFEALEVACDWLRAGDADAVVVVGVEESGAIAAQVLSAVGLPAPVQGGFALLLASAPAGRLLDVALLARLLDAADEPQNPGFRGLEAFCRAAGLPGPEGFGTVGRPE